MLTFLLRLILGHQIKPFVFTNKYNNETINFDVENLGLYVHIPFCKKICSFCPYNKDLYNEEDAKRFLNSLLKEIEIVGKDFNGIKKHVTSLYFGGGSPALLIDDLSAIINLIKKYFIIDGNIGIELHPDNITTESMTKLKDIGFNMVSVGVQTFSEESSKYLGRNSNYNESKVLIAKNAGFDVIDVDLIFGYKGQTEETILSDFNKAIDCGATQISTYPFIEFSFSKNKTKPLNHVKKIKLLNKLLVESKKHNFERSSVWTFAKTNTDKYSSVTRDNYIGFGPSATTLVNDRFKINTFNLNSYVEKISNNKIPTALTMKFNKRTRALYWLFWSFYNMDVNPAIFKKLFKEPIEKYFKLEFRFLQFLGMLSKTAEGFKVTKIGSFAYHYAEQNYTTQYIDKTWKIMKQNDFPREIKLY